MKRLYTLMLLAMGCMTAAMAQWNTNATPKCIYEAPAGSDYYACTSKAVRTADSKTWIAWKTWGVKYVGETKCLAVRTYLQLLSADGVPQFDEPILVNDHITASWWSQYSLQVAADGSAIVTVADGRTEETAIPTGSGTEAYSAQTFTPAIYKVSQEGDMLWGLDGVEYRQYTNAEFTRAIVVGEDTYFFFYNQTYDGSGTADDMTDYGTFVQRISDDGTEAWDTPRKWSDDQVFPTLVPSTDSEFLLIENSPLGALCHRLNADLEEVWGEAVLIDDNSSSDKSMQPYKAVSDGQGGAAVAFVRAMGGFSHNIRVQHIYADGSLGFGLTGLDAADTEDNDYDYCNIAANPATEQILVDFESQINDNGYHVMLQGFSYDGDYLFEPLGLSIAQKTTNSGYAFGSVGCGALSNGDWIVAYRDVQAWGANTSFIIRRYDADGKQLWTRTIGRNLDPSSITFIVEEDASYLFYREYAAAKNPGITVFRIANDGTYSQAVGISEQPASSTAACQQHYYSLDGKQLQQPGRGISIVRHSDGTMSKVMK